MGRFRATATMQVYAFEQEWRQFSRSPRAVTREAFAELVAIAHLHAAAIAHAASPYVFEMILLTMIVGLVHRADALQERGLLSQAETVALQANLKTVTHHLRRRLANQKHELYTLARALRTEDQNALLALLRAVQSHAGDLLGMKPSHTALVPPDASLTDNVLLTILIECMCGIRRLEKQNEGHDAIISLEQWSQICAA